ncbi:DNA-binding FadR family transcriptional regulator [Actinokineospora baliensis]|uniref:FadR/GntR family transcriptional regulator n=1 Tax=Actinokineospora baliensis TaxID=547056 RepID=UPI0019589362|nr:GntR family transcriptional regulator [Actinokineospora baliensis]MBM7772304.1 DNA-binding FadR family transcriptional regulator [Actinokineospora baliensis]
MSNERVGRSLLREEVSERIKRYILDNRLRPGAPLPTENELCAALGASRSSVREAIKTLDALDIVEVRHGHGTYVGELSLSALVEGLTFRGLLSPDDEFAVLSELVEVRELFERGNAERILDALDGEHLACLDELVDRMDRGEDTVGADRAFHALLVHPLGNELVRQFTDAFWDVYTTLAPHLGLPTDEHDTVALHRGIVDAARAEDLPGFTKAVAAHYAPIRHRIAAARG